MKTRILLIFAFGVALMQTPTRIAIAQDVARLPPPEPVCNPSALVAIAREMIGPEVVRLPVIATDEATVCQLPERLCKAEQESIEAAWRADILRRMRNEVLHLERCGY